MIPQRNFVFADKATSAYISNDYVNSIADVLDIQVSGTFTSADIIIEGKSDLNADYVALKVIDLAQLKAVSNITSTGIFELGITGLQVIRIKINSVAGGNVTVVGRIVKEG